MDHANLDKVDPSILAALGLVITKWAYVEAAEAEILSHFMHADKGAMYVITGSVSGSSVTNWIRTMVPVRFGSKSDQDLILDLLSHIDRVRGERNALVHGLWKPGPEPATATVQTVRWDRSEVAREELVTETDLIELRNEIDGLVMDALQLERVLDRAFRNQG